MYVQDHENLYKVNINRGNDATFPSITTGYGMELDVLTDDDHVGSNWAQSCTPYGTPGQGRLYPCTVTCDVDNCQSEGLASAICDTIDAPGCNCDADTSYFNQNGVCATIANGGTNCS